MREDEQALRARQQVFLARETFALYHRRLLGAVVAAGVMVVGASLLLWAWQAAPPAVAWALAAGGVALGATVYILGRIGLHRLVARRFGVTEISSS